MVRPAVSAYPAQADLLAADPLFPWIDRNFLRCDPFAFNGYDFQDFCLRCSAEFGVDPNGVYCAGSGAVGLSLNPEKMLDGVLKNFDDKSDLDIAFISDFHFDMAWRDLRQRAHPALNEMESEFAEAMKHQKKRFFDGAILANKLLQDLDFGSDWLRSLVRISEFVATELNREVEINIWIYRDYWSLRSYIANSILKCRGLVK